MMMMFTATLDRRARRTAARQGHRPGRPIPPVPTPPPERYRCTGCGASGVKLWREYQTLPSATALLCAPCACKAQGKPDTVGPDGRRCDEVFGDRTDQIGWMVPAVPVDDTFWGYSAVPREACAWWRALPTRIAQLSGSAEAYFARWREVMGGDPQPCCSDFAWDSNMQGVGGHHPACKWLHGSSRGAR